MNAENIVTIPVRLGDDLDVVYHVKETDAPSDYDGFGTFSVHEYEGNRTVLIRAEHLNWQLARYQSGNHYATDPQAWLDASYLVDILYRRLIGNS